MKTLVIGLIFCAGFLAWSESAAVLPGGCRTHCPPEYPPPPAPVDDPPDVGPVVHEVPGLRTIAGRTIPHRIIGHLCEAGNKEETTGSRPSRSRSAVSFDGLNADWSAGVRLTVTRSTDFRIIVQSNDHTTYDAFAFEGVDPGCYVFTLDSHCRSEEPIDVALEHNGRVLRTRTVYPEVMEP
jgi:hypothetical protein